MLDHNILLLLVIGSLICLTLCQLYILYRMVNFCNILQNYRYYHAHNYSKLQKAQSQLPAVEHSSTMFAKVEVFIQKILVNGKLQHVAK